MESYEQTLLRQYDNSPNLKSIIKTFNDAVDPAVDIDNFYDNIWNIETSNDYGLDIWGKIVNISRLVTIDSDDENLGFNESLLTQNSDNQPQPFGQAPFYNGTRSTSTVRLATDAYRKLILVKALANITDCTIPNLNKLLLFLFDGQGTPFVADTGNMTIRYVFNFNLDPVDLAIVKSSGALPRPAGVLAQIMQVDTSNTFGFSESGMDAQPFGQGALFSSSGITNAI
ncbi:DUF2612 domain-containing protein [Rouxiella sp. WC2420]|uniref:DUF2612 domain-containing protein n=1 Tax=Rouxiella sp. WC2420 TaxID=3234145 RepID=A0AB39VLH7_9GAMM